MWRFAGGDVRAAQQRVEVALTAGVTLFDTAVDRSAAAYSWIMTHPANPIPIAGTQNVARIASIGDAYKPRWKREEWYAVLEASLGEKLP